METIFLAHEVCQMLLEHFNELKLRQKQKRRVWLNLSSDITFPGKISSIISIYPGVFGSGDWMIQPWT